MRWASISELYRSEMLGEKEIPPPGVIRPAAYLIVPRCPVEHAHDEPLRREPGEDASEHRS